jgi:PP-loop superfamily ATP-utilizing enzyme
MQKARDKEVRIVAWCRVCEERPTLYDVISNQCNEHRVLDVVVEGVAVSNAFERKTGYRWNEFGQMRLSRPKPAAQMGGKV